MDTIMPLMYTREIQLAARSHSPPRQIVDFPADIFTPFAALENRADGRQAVIVMR